MNIIYCLKLMKICLRTVSFKQQTKTTLITTSMNTLLSDVGSLLSIEKNSQADSSHRIHNDFHHGHHLDLRVSSSRFN